MAARALPPSSTFLVLLDKYSSRMDRNHSTICSVRSRRVHSRSPDRILALIFPFQSWFFVHILTIAEMLEDVKELEWLHNDVEERPFPGFAESDPRLETKTEKNLLEGCSRCSLFCNGRTLEITEPDVNIWNRPHDTKRRQLLSELESIYHNNGWPCKRPAQTLASYRVFRHLATSST